MKKSNTISTLVLSLSMFCLNAYAQTDTQTQQTKSETPPKFLLNQDTKSATELLIYQQYVSNVQVSIGETAGTIYLYGVDGWNVYQADSECPTPTYATIATDKAGAQELLSVVLAAKTLNKPISLHGVCGYHPAYFEISKIIY